MTKLLMGDCLDLLRVMPDNSVDSIVTDPPYGLEFMGKRWDYDVPGVEVWVECLRVLKPGGHVLSFGGSRTYHRLAVNVEDAGFEIRDQIMWVYGSGFPKSHNGEWGGTALKPAHEPIVMARKPLTGTVAENVLQHGTGAINVEACRVAGEPVPVFDTVGGRKFEQTHTQPARRTRQVGTTTAGRWPANLIHDGSDEVLAAFPQAPGQQGATGVRKQGLVYGTVTQDGEGVEPRTDTGSAARFFYCAKASRRDRGEGNTHPTVKPTDLMRYLCRLVTPAGGVVLDPFMGSGSTGKAAVLEGFKFIGIEREAEYYAIAVTRIYAAKGE